MASNRYSVLQVSDLHVDPGLPSDLSVLHRAQKQIEALQPDLVVVTGDVSQDGYKHPEMFERIREAMARWPAPVRVIPGNHDVGDRFMSGDPKTGHLDRWTAVFGIDRFSEQNGRWRVLGLDSEIIGVGLPEEERQHEWFVAELDAAGRAGQWVGVFMHGPPYLRDPAEHFTDHSSYWAIRPHARPRLLEQLERPHVRLLANGHMHWHYATQHKGLPWYWAPSAKAAVDDARFPGDGEIVGLMHYQFGEGQVDAQLIKFDVPPGTYYFGRPKVTAPGRDKPIELAHLVVPLHLVWGGQGAVPAAMGQCLAAAADKVRLTVLADKPDAAAKLLANLPVRIRSTRDVTPLLDAMGKHRLVAIGDAGRDAALLNQSAIALTIGGSCSASVQVSVPDVTHALALIADPLQLQRALQGK
jgi:alkaline phosphatase D